MTVCKQQSRDYKYDTIRLAMIFLVIVGHEMELFYSGNSAIQIYKIIYSFHIPVLIYVTGVFACFDRQKIIKHLIFPYVLFQVAYSIFHTMVLGDYKVIQFATPYWILWYLLSIVIYYVLIPMFPGKNAGRACVVLILSVIFSLAIGFDDSVGYYLSLSRTFYFLPFFVMGYYKNELLSLLENKRVRNLCLLSSVIMVVAGAMFIVKGNVHNGVLYGSFSYSASGSTILDRIIVLSTSFAWVMVFEYLTSSKEIPVVSKLGQNTMPIYLFHGFVIRLMYKFKIFNHSVTINMLLSCVIAVAIILMFGNKYVNLAFKKIF